MIRTLTRRKFVAVAPEAAELLQTVPKEEWEGLLFKLKWQRNHGKSVRVDTVSPLICDIGKKAGVKVAEKKIASAHDLWRSFGLRWADRVKPHVLQQLMRHAFISTTLTFYVQSNADDMAEALWSAFDQQQNSTTKTVPLKESANEESLESRT